MTSDDLATAFFVPKESLGDEEAADLPAGLASSRGSQTVISFGGQAAAETAYVRAGDIPQMTLENDFLAK